MIVVALASVLLAMALPATILAQLLATSLMMKELILAVIPLIIFSCSYQCMYKLNQYGLLLLALMIFMIMASNFISSWIGFSLANVFVNFVKIPDLKSNLSGLEPAWALGLPKLIGNEVALVTGLALGLLSRVFNQTFARQMNTACLRLSGGLMNYCLLPILPLFMSGFIIKMVHDGLFGVILRQCGVFALVLVSTYVVYLFMGYLLVAKGQLKQAKFYIKNILGAGWIGLSTMSSLAALPLTLKGSEENTKHKDVVGGVLPISTNVHLIGDSIAIPFTALLMMASFAGAWPTLAEYSYFAVLLVLAKFSVAAVPGGGILVILPILQSVFGFTAEMSALITLIYILLDPLITATNIMGNGLFVIVVDKVWSKIHRGSPSTLPTQS